MNKQKAFDLRQFLPYAVAILVFALIIIVYFYPTLEGKKFEASDVAQFKGMSKEITDYKVTTGEQILWTNQMFVGMPAYQI